MEEIRFDDVESLRKKVSTEWGPFGGELEVTADAPNEESFAGGKQEVHTVDELRRCSAAGEPVTRGRAEPQTRRAHFEIHRQIHESRSFDKGDTTC